jgi:hypothetical protein
MGGERRVRVSQSGACFFCFCLLRPKKGPGSSGHVKSPGRSLCWPIHSLLPAHVRSPTTFSAHQIRGPPPPPSGPCLSFNANGAFIDCGKPQPRTIESTPSIGSIERREAHVNAAEAGQCERANKVRKKASLKESDPPVPGVDTHTRGKRGGSHMGQKRFFELGASKSLARK